MSGIVFAQKKDAAKPIPAITYKDGKLSYQVDSLGNRVPDFSYAGYKAGETPIPHPIATYTIPLVDGDATALIQNAIDHLGTKKINADGFRGVLLLQEGEYQISGELKIKHSGIVIRGAGMNKTILLASGKGRRTLIEISGDGDLNKNKPIKISEQYVPVNAMEMNIPSGHMLKKGDKVLVHRPSTLEWIIDLGTDHFGGDIGYLSWKPGDYDIYWDRTITDVVADKIYIDAPITTALESKYGGGYIIPYTWNGRIENIGIEDLTCISEYDKTNPKDEAHSWVAISIENTQDAWVRNVSFNHFAGSAVSVLESAKRITVENCKALAPISEIGGQRRYTFFTSGQQTLFQRLYAEDGYHDFAVGYTAAGPNAFVQCQSELPHSYSGSVDSWASGTLFDIVNVNGNALSFKNRRQEGQGIGWSTANSVFWQCTASLIECFAPPTAQNWSFGSWAEFSGDGKWEDSNNHVKPRSLYYAQLQDRLGDQYTDRADLLPVDSEASSSPSIGVAAELTKQAYSAPITLLESIDQVAQESIIENEKAPLYRAKLTSALKTKNNNPQSITNGWITRSGKVQYGGKQSVPWWSGSLKPTFLEKNAKPHITRFVPRRTGLGLTDDLDSVAHWMKKKNIIAIDHNYGLWYDRRRDDHERIRRMNGEVWAPFYEQPFARSGQGISYDGLSKYDLTKYNDWYWSRLKDFAQLADEEGLILMHQNYFQHNIIEAGAHWADSPWRPANNINETGFPEPAPYAGDKRIFVAEQFYDIEHPVRKELHRAYIKQCLNNFIDNSVIQLISEEYTGPLHFVEFWLDVIAEWEAETGKKQLIALSTTKDVQDAILADPIRSKIVDIIDIRYWFYRNDGTTYAPQGGQNLAPRQHARLTKPGAISFESVFRAVNEYKQKFPEKAVTFYASTYPQQAWAVFMAKGSLASLPKIPNEQFFEDATQMDVMIQKNKEGQYVLGNPSVGYIIHSDRKDLDLDFIDTKESYEVYWINRKSGEINKEKQLLKGKNPKLTNKKEAVVWLKKK